MKIVANTPDLLHLRERNIRPLFGSLVMLAAGIAYFWTGSLAQVFDPEASLRYAYRIIIFAALCIYLPYALVMLATVPDSSVRFDRTAGMLQVVHRALIGPSRLELPLDRVTGAIVTQSDHKGRIFYDVALSLSLEGLPPSRLGSSTTLPVALLLSSGQAAENLRDTLNDWLARSRVVRSDPQSHP